MNNSYVVRDESQVPPVEIGRLELSGDVGSLDVIRLARDGYLNLVRERSKSELKAQAAEQAKNEAALANPEEALSQVQEEIAAEDAAARELPSGDLVFATLRPRQMKALCAREGLKTYGTRETLLERLEQHFGGPVAPAEDDDGANPQGDTGDTDDGEADDTESDGAAPVDVNLDEKTDDELRVIAAGLGVSAKGGREALIKRIQKAVDG